MLIDKLKWIYRAYRYRFKLEPQEIQLLSQNLNQGDVGVDVGAHKGAYTYWMRKSVGPDGKVYAFEPQSVLAGRLKALTGRQHYQNVVVENLGLSSSSGTLSLNVPGKSSSPGASFENMPDNQSPGQSYPVQVTTLDAYFSPDSTRGIHLLKCDAEGHELEVFKGAERLLTSHHPCLLFECERRHRASGRVDDVFSYLESLNYRGFFIDRGGPKDIDRFDPGIHQAESGAPGYVNNFLFLGA
jgi:FkbM family methyltransferase